MVTGGVVGRAFSAQVTPVRMGWHATDNFDVILWILRRPTAAAIAAAVLYGVTLDFRG